MSHDSFSPQPQVRFWARYCEDWVGFENHSGNAGTAQSKAVYLRVLITLAGEPTAIE